MQAKIQNDDKDTNSRRKKEEGSHARKNLAIIGSGIASLSSAWMWKDQYDITIFDIRPKLGGHIDTVYVDPSSVWGSTSWCKKISKKEPFSWFRNPPPPSPLKLDLGFMVFNGGTYPKLIELYRELGIKSQKSDMSWSFQNRGNGLAFSGKLYLSHGGCSLVCAYEASPVFPSIWCFPFF